MTLTFARRLRRDMTEAEKVMWRILRARQLAGYKFRRQQPIDHYIVDFVCFSHRLVIEIDGGQHMESKSDEIRPRYLARNGFRILRFWNNDVLENREGVSERVVETLREPLTLPSLRAGPLPLPRGERGKLPSLPAIS
jgi:very-short-patch-repair endonuclease